MEKMDLVGYPLSDAIVSLRERNIKFTISYTVPQNRGFFKLYEDRLYIIRQKNMDNGSIELIAAAKMRKEV